MWHIRNATSLCINQSGDNVLLELLTHPTPADVFTFTQGSEYPGLAGAHIQCTDSKRPGTELRVTPLPVEICVWIFFRLYKLSHS